jgi:hypothetical protein
MSDAINKLLPKSIELRPLQLRTQFLPIVRHVLQIGFPGHHGTQSSYLFINPALYRLYKAVMCTFVALRLQYLLYVDLADLVNSRIHHHLLVRLGLHGLVEELQLHFPLHCDLNLLDVTEYLGDLLVHILPVLFVPRFLFTCILRVLNQCPFQVVMIFSKFFKDSCLGFETAGQLLFCDFLGKLTSEVL